MNDRPKPDWDPVSEYVLRDQRAAFDRMRESCPVAYSEFMHWSLFRHEDITRVLHDPETFSNVVSRHLSVPNGMDPPEHTGYRRIVEQYFTRERMQVFEPVCRELVTALVRDVLRTGQADLMADFALPFAVRAQCGFLGWPEALHGPLVRWTRKNHDATLARDRQAMSEIAREFNGLVDRLLEGRARTRADAGDDIMAALMRDQVRGRPLRNEEIASILRNWTVGEIGTISAAIGILVHFLAGHPDLQRRLRTDPALLPAAIDEILRIHGPLVANRRVTTRAVEIGGRRIDAGERISLFWIAGNRDGRVFSDPDEFRLDRDPAVNLLYGAGIHVCPGAPLARLELRVVMEELLGRTAGITLVPGRPARNARYPASGFSGLPVNIS